MEETGIVIENVGKSFGKRKVLNEVSLSVRPGQITGIIGRNGSGKSVLFKCICGLFDVDEGEIRIRGEKVTPGKSTGGELGMLIEQPGFLPYYSGYRNLEILASLQGKIGKNQIEEVLKAVGLFEERKKAVGKYSMGMKQRLAIAQAIMEDQSILILDEPMNGLDNKGAEEMRSLFRKLKEEGKLLLLATHNREDVEFLCDEVYEMDAGTLKPVPQRFS